MIAWASAIFSSSELLLHWPEGAIQRMAPRIASLVLDTEEDMTIAMPFGGRE